MICGVAEMASCRNWQNDILSIVISSTDVSSTTFHAKNRDYHSPHHMSKHTNNHIQTHLHPLMQISVSFHLKTSRLQHFCPKTQDCHDLSIAKTTFKLMYIPPFTVGKMTFHKKTSHLKPFRLQRRNNLPYHSRSRHKQIQIQTCVCPLYTK